MRQNLKADFDLKSHSDLKLHFDLKSYMLEGLHGLLCIAEGWEPSDRDVLLLRALVLALLLLAFFSTCFYCLFPIAVFRDGRNMSDEQERQVEVRCCLSTDINVADVKRICEGSPTWYQFLRFTWIMGRAVANSGLLFYTVWTLRPLEKKTPWDLETQLVTFGEGICAGALLSVMLALFLHFLCRGDTSSCLNVCEFAIHAGRFSALQMLPLGNPAVLLSHLKNYSRDRIVQPLRAKGTPAALGAVVAYYAILAVTATALFSLAIMSVCVKVAKLRFIAEGVPWTPRNYIDFVQFVNALAGLRGDIEQSRLRIIFDVMDETTYRGSFFQEKLVDKLSSLHGRFTTLVLFTTLSSIDSVNLMRRERQILSPSHCSLPS
ncbi:unnamed protein product [Symbiodinium sp. CCMP2592]|nr:unnamed protein product [Symbiodinium sp. CCMP2592]